MCCTIASGRSTLMAVSRHQFKANLTQPKNKHIPEFIHMGVVRRTFAKCSQVFARGVFPVGENGLLIPSLYLFSLLPLTREKAIGTQWPKLFFQGRATATGRLWPNCFSKTARKPKVTRTNGLCNLRSFGLMA